jgi:hypothetical protein
MKVKLHFLALTLKVAYRMCITLPGKDLRKICSRRTGSLLPEQ